MSQEETRPPHQRLFSCAMIAETVKHTAEYHAYIRNGVELGVPLAFELLSTSSIRTEEMADLLDASFNAAIKAALTEQLANILHLFTVSPSIEHFLHDLGRILHQKLDADPDLDRMKLLLENFHQIHQARKDI